MYKHQQSSQVRAFEPPTRCRRFAQALTELRRIVVFNAELLITRVIVSAEVLVELLVRGVTVC